MFDGWLGRGARKGVLWMGGIKGSLHTSADLLKARNPKNIMVLLSTTVKNQIIVTNLAVPRFIGSHEHHKKFNISVKLGLEGVGDGMQDNPCISVSLQTQCLQKRQPDAPSVTGITDYFRFIIQALALPICLNASRMPIAAKIAFPASKGKLELDTTDPRQNPSVIFNYLVEEKDLEDSVKMVQLIERVAKSESVSLHMGITVLHPIKQN
ncbi:hypothetical protein Dsin_010055 [Dipteronia sinensis]|uniref:Glucose-methanol-choline oxidoreductase C-terminal domain-containing protein n=1 Tax=Dipteronia sinensis TaxID=43782 RepID=A0AAE0EE21_9ROSI|nr:hypothetical protein Dsin_010055 [Dipteronia sinensis]